jgi:hypothetical protein
MTNSKRLVENIFLTIYFLAGMYFGLVATILILAVNLRALQQSDLGDILGCLYLFVPLIVSSIGILVSFKRRDTTVYLWLCSIFWLITFLGEIIKGHMRLPYTLFIISMLVVSLSCIIFLTIQNKIIKK